MISFNYKKSLLPGEIHQSKEGDEGSEPGVNNNHLSQNMDMAQRRSLSSALHIQINWMHMGDKERFS